MVVMRVGDKVMATIFPSHLNDTTKLECAPASMALVIHRHCSKSSVAQNGCDSMPSSSLADDCDHFWGLL